MRGLSSIVLGLSIISLGALHAREAQACGGCTVSQSESTQVTGHRMILSISKDATTLWDQIEYSGDPKDFGWMLPIKGNSGFVLETDFNVSSDALFATLDDLTKLRSVSQRVDHFCVEGWTARAEWTGVRVSELARLAGATSDAQYVDFQSFDSDYHESWDIESALHPQTLVAYGMDRAMLGPGHGAPARVHSPVKLGYKNTKYLTKVLFMPTRAGGYWSDRGYEWYAGV
jgi:hypothetical protein